MAETQYGTSVQMKAVPTTTNVSILFYIDGTKRVNTPTEIGYVVVKLLPRTIPALTEVRSIDAITVKTK
jgi:hypothetical protein